LKPKGYLIKNSSSAGKVHEPRATQVNVKIIIEERTLKEISKQVHSVEPSTGKVEVKLKVLKVIILEIKFDIEMTDTFTSEDKESISTPIVINNLPILSFPEEKVYVSRNLEEHYLYPNSSPITMPIITYDIPEEPNSIFTSPAHLYLPSPHDIFPKVAERLVVRSFEAFENLIFSPRSPSPRISMVGTGAAEGERASGKAPPPRIFSKLFSRYAPLVLPTVLHDLPKNYMNNFPKFMGEGDLTTTEHIAFFDQFVDILGIEHEDLYSILLVQTFEGKVRTWFRGLPVGSV
jgi:hypothetical protein